MRAFVKTGDRWLMPRMGAAALWFLAAGSWLTTVPVCAQEPGGFSKQRLAPSVVSLAGVAWDVDAVDVIHYELNLTLAMTEELMGGTTSLRVVLKNIAGGMTDRVALHAARLQIDSARVNGVACSVATDSYAEAIALIAPSGVHFMSGETLAVSIGYRRLAGVTRPGGRWGYYYFRDSLGIPAHLGYTMSEPSDARFWMPCHDDPSDKATADIRVTVPDGYVAVSNGKLLGTDHPVAGFIRWHWREDHLIAPYLMAITASRFTVSSMPFVRAAGDTIPLQYYVWAPDSVETAAYLPVVHEMTAGLSEIFGPYPFDKYGMVCIVPFSYGGMEHQSITTMNRHLKTEEWVVLHELAHQWWGNLVTCATWADIWLNESFATYSEALWHELKGGPDGLRSYMMNSLLHFYYGSWQGAAYDPEGQGFHLFDDVVYSKGAWILHTLRGAVGDSVFFRTLRAYRARYAGSNATTAQFQAVADSVAGSSTAWFFDAWVHGMGWPIYNVRRGWSGDTLKVTVSQLQSASWPVFPMWLQLRIRGGGHDTTVTVWNDARSATYAFRPGFAADSIELDPQDRVLKQVTYTATAVEEVIRVPEHMMLEQNYPNPFNGTTVIRFSAGDAAGARVRLVVHDVLGREVAVLYEGPGAVGERSVSFDASRLASGVYLYTLQAGERRSTRPMLLIR